MAPIPQRSLLPIVAVCAIAFALWPAFIDRNVADGRSALSAVDSGPAPVLRDYEQRDALVAFWEGAVREHHTNDMLSPRQLAAQYLQRYRERGDLGDVLRAQHMDEAALAVSPRYVPALDEMISILLTLHRFRDALHYADEVLGFDPRNAGFLAQKAELEMELGRYDSARRTLDRIRPEDRDGAQAETAFSRYDELDGSLNRARVLLDDALAQADERPDESAQSRAWFHMRAGELAFTAGDIFGAVRREHEALAIFPTYNLAFKDLAKFELCNRRPVEALDAAQRGAAITPFAETLGYESDAQAQLGQTPDSRVTREVIFAIERIGNAYHVNDRLLANYYADHQLRAPTALAIARREAAVRGDEIYAQDTLAWAAAMDGRWTEAKDAIARATRRHTQDALVAYHEAVIDLHFGERRRAKALLQRALDENPRFHPVYAKDARNELARL